MTTLIPLEREWSPRSHLSGAMARRSSLHESDGDAGVDVAVLPLVAGCLVQANTHGVGAGLAGVERAELDVTGQAGDWRRRLVAVDAGLQHVQLSAVQPTEVVGTEADAANLDTGRNRPGVGDRELVDLDHAGSEIGVRQIEGSSVVAVGQLNGECARSNRHCARVAGREISPGDATCPEEGQSDSTSSCPADDELADAAVLAARGH